MEEYIIQEFDEQCGWFLYRVCGSNRETADTCLARVEAEFPTKKFRVTKVRSEDCWWNDPFLAN